MQISYLQKIASVFQVDNGDPNRYFSVYTMNNFLNAFGGRLFLHYPVRNFTFDGFEDEILNATKVIPVPAINYGKFGWFYKVRA